MVSMGSVGFDSIFWFKAEPESSLAIIHSCIDC